MTTQVMRFCDRNNNAAALDQQKQQQQPPPQSDSSNPDMYLGIWKQLWSRRDTAWHLDRPHPTLQRYLDRLLDGRSSNVRFLFPLCGKNVDMRHLWRQGHQVTGVECADEAIQDVFVGNGIQYSSRTIGHGSGQIHSTSDGRFRVVQHNFLTLNEPSLNGQFDVVWDRGAFGTITEKEQLLYVQTVRRLLAKDFKYLLLVLEFDESQFTDLPYNQPEDKVRKFFASFANIEKLESKVPEHVGLYQRHMGGPLEVRETTYLMTAKVAPNSTLGGA